MCHFVILVHTPRVKFQISPKLYPNNLWKQAQMQKGAQIHTWAQEGGMVRGLKATPPPTWKFKKATPLKILKAVLAKIFGKFAKFGRKTAKF